MNERVLVDPTKIILSTKRVNVTPNSFNHLNSMTNFLLSNSKMKTKLKPPHMSLRKTFQETSVSLFHPYVPFIHPLPCGPFIFLFILSPLLLQLLSSDTKLFTFSKLADLISTQSVKNSWGHCKFADR